MSKTVTLRIFQAPDVTFGLEQTSREGWDATRDVFELILSHDPDGSFIAEEAGRRVGMVTTTVYERTAWIGNLIVLPDARGRGIGRQLLQHALAEIDRRGIATVRLEADPPGMALYRKLGFREEFESPRFRLAAGSPVDHGAYEPLVMTDRADLVDFDAERFGDRRDRLLNGVLHRAIATCILRSGTRIRAYAVLFPSSQGLRIGPWLAEDRDAAIHVLKGVLGFLRESQVITAVPGVNHDSIDLLRTLGFVPSPSSIRMVWGKVTGIGRPDQIYAIGQGAMG